MTKPLTLDLIEAFVIDSNTRSSAIVVNPDKIRYIYASRDKIQISPSIQVSACWVQLEGGDRFEVVGGLNHLTERWTQALLNE